MKVRITFKTSPSIWGVTIATHRVAATEHKMKIANGDSGAVSLSSFGYLKRNKGIGGTGLGHSAMVIKIVARRRKDYGSPLASKGYKPTGD